jgi:hypothetical protein
MELAIPVVAFAGLYTVLKQKKREGMQTQHRNLHTDKYYTPKTAPSVMYPNLAGTTTDASEVSSTMKPFFGKTKNIGNTFTNYAISEDILDGMVGGGSSHRKKEEIAPMFTPNQNSEWPHGAPNQNEFFKSRVIPGNNMTNEKPWQEVHVGPGLNQGFSSAGTGGFNSGMEAQSEWMDKNVDDLRVLTNPKTSYTLNSHEGPAHTLVTNMGKEGKVEKYSPDAFYVNTPDRYLVTNGAIMNPTDRKAIQPDVHRQFVPQEYIGNAGNGASNEQTKHPMHRLDHRQQFSKSEAFTPAGSATDQNNLNGILQTYTMLPTNRQHEGGVGGLGSLVSAITAPIMDMLRPTRKEDLVGMANTLGLKTTVPNMPIQDLVMPATIKQSTIYDPLTMGARPHRATADGGYQVSEHTPIHNQRDSTTTSHVNGGMSILPQQRSTFAEMHSTVPEDRGIESRMPNGNGQIFNPKASAQISISKDDKSVSYSGDAFAFNLPLGAADYGSIRTTNTYAEPARNTPDILKAFKQNPYTHSLHSVA